MNKKIDAIGVIITISVIALAILWVVNPWNPSEQKQGVPHEKTADEQILDAQMDAVRQKFALHVQDTLFKEYVSATAIGDALLITSDWNRQRRARFVADLKSGGACDLGFRRVRFSGVRTAAEEINLECREARSK